MCNCKQEMEQKLAAAFMATLPTGSQNLTAELGGFGLLMGADQNLEHKNQAEVQFTYRLPAQAGEKPKKTSMRVTGNFCMFCGERYGQEHTPVS